MIPWSMVRKGLLVFTILLVGNVSLLAQSPVPEDEAVSSHLLDGRNYIGQNGSKGMPADHDDEFIFSNGMFRSTSCDKYGFVSGRYQATSTDGAIMFNAVTKSPTHGKMIWEGTVAGDSLDATFVWTKKRWYWDLRKEYWFKGKLKH